MSEQDLALTRIAIVGMSGRFPGASSVEAFWQNLRAGVESVQFFSDEEALASGVSPAQLDDPSYVKARAIFDGAELFDASFFGYNPREAAIMDPQQRLFLECAWESLEHAGYDPATYPGLIGVFGGASMNTYLLANLYPNRDLIGLIGDFQAMIGNDKDYLTTRVSYKLDLKGPSVTVQTACSTSLVAISLACQSLLQYQCDMALAGGSSIGVPQRGGYLFQEGGIGSPDGHCRAFDAGAHGTVGGDGVGVVVLKRLEDALDDGDTIHGLITGFAINNDGAVKAGYTAPSVEGQAQVIEAAQTMADADPETIGYVEAHGTATPLGDPIEIAALTQVFRARTDKTGFCAIGSVKTNIGHLNAAAGVAGLIKTVMALKHKRIPPSLHYTAPNPQIDFASSPFFVNSRLAPWTTRGGPRRAGVSSFGIGGTNAHVIVEEAPPIEPSGDSRPWQLLLLSARSAAALEAATDNLAAYLEQDANLADMAYTLQVGRHAFNHRRMLLCRDLDDARRALTAQERGRLPTRSQEDPQRPVAFLFPGGGAQHLTMAADLYEYEPTFRQEIDRCVELLRPQLGLDLRQVLYPHPEHTESAARQMRQTALALPALFMVEYALAQLWISWGIRPAYMIGHSLGEYVAACLAGVFSLEDALKLVVLRGRLMQQLQPGAMLSVAAAPEEIQPFLKTGDAHHLSLAAINGPALCVVSGTAAAIAELEALLSQRGLNVRQLHIDVAAHSALVEPILDTFTSFVQTLRLNAPQLPYLSNVTGTWASAADATDPRYWARHLRETVRFADGLQTLLGPEGAPDLVLLEVGPSQTLSTLARGLAGQDQIVLASMRHPNDQQSDQAFVLSTLGQLWLAGVVVDWPGFAQHERRRRVPLPTYPFERQRYWIDPPSAAVTVERRSDLLHIPAEVVTAAPAIWEQSTLHPRPYLPNDYLAPRSDLEQLIAGVWQNLLGIETIGVEDNFFALGGHSLLATQIVARVAEACRVELPLRSLFETPTIAGLAEQVTRISGDRPTIADRSIVPVARDGSPPLSFAQQRLWFIDQLVQDLSAYNIPAAVRLRGRLDAAAMDRALAEVQRRHEILRTTFELLDGQPVQQIASAGMGALDRIDLRHLLPDEREAEAQRLATIAAQQPFDLAVGPLLRSSLMRLGDDEHVLMLVMHHIVADEWSLGLLIRELTSLYSAFSEGQASSLPPLPIQYADFAVWQREWLSGTVLDQQLGYWQRQLADAPILQLPTDRPRLPVGTFRGTNRSFTLSLELADQLRALSQQAGCTLFMTLLAAFQTLLSRYSGQDDIVVSTAVANRRRPELETLIGCFVNILALRVDLADRPPFLDLLGRVRDVCLHAYTHQDLPFELLVELLHLERDLSYNPLAQVMFIVQNAPLNIYDLPELSVEPAILFERAAAQFDLTMHVWEQPDGLRGIVEYNTDLFDAGTIDRMLGHFEVLLKAIVANPERRVSALPLLAEADREQILVEWNATQALFPHDACLHELIEAQVARTPDATALVFEGESLTYAELDRRANRLAHHLRGLGVQPETRVAICVERSIELVVGLLAILKAGGAYVPLDPGYPAERLQWMLHDSQAPVLLTQQSLLATLPAHSAQVVLLDAGWTTIDRHSASKPTLALAADQLAYVIYTSGSTGQPKGAMNTHRAIVNRLLWMQDTYGLAGDDRVLQKTPFSFDVSVWEFFWPLLAGATLVVARPEGHKDPAYLVDLIARERITTLHFVPPMLHAFLAEPHLDRCQSLRRVICSGEALPFELQEQFFARLDAELHNLYGPTEAAVDVTWWPCRPNSGLHSVPIGRPIANTQIYLLDRQLEPVPVGVPGELYIGGVQLARGYQDRPALTAERFIPDPFSQTPNARLYRTGDLARFLPTGAIEYLGRLDHQVKLRGFRIELGEIEAALRQFESVDDAVVMLRDERLVAYVVGEQRNKAGAPWANEQRSTENLPSPVATGEGQGVRAITEGLRAFLASRLPDYMIPSAFVFLDALPLTPNGKVDRGALPTPEPEMNELDQLSAAPRTPIEDLLAGIWADVLGLPHVNLHDNFFELGGHSLLATQVLSRVRAALSVTLPLRELFESPTVARIASRVAAARQDVTLPPLRPADRDGAIPLSFAQQRLWLLDQIQPQSPFYNVPLAVRLSGGLDRAALEWSLGALLRRHEILRTTFTQEISAGANQPQQVIAPAETAAVDLTVVDLRGLPDAEREQEARRWAEREARRPFDLGRGPLLHGALLRLGQEDHILILTLHHIVADGWSLGVLMREIAALYQAQIEGIDASLAALPVQYADYAIWQRQWLSGDVLEQQFGYWRQQLAGIVPLDLPTDRPRPPVQSFNGAIHQFTLPADLAAALASLSRQEGVTLFMTLLAAFQTVLSRYSGQTDIVVGSPIAGRTQPAVEGLIGCFINTLVLRADLADRPTFRDLLQQVREVCLDAYAHQDLPFELLVEALQPERDLSHHPLFQVLFALQNAPIPELSVPGLTLRPLEVSSGTARLDLALSMTETADGLLGTFEYNTDLFAAATIARLADHLQMLLASAADEPNRRVTDLALLTAADQDQLSAWNATDLALPADLVPQRLLEQAARTPQATALVCGTDTLTYAELLGRANQLAHFLRAQGVRPESRVAVLLPRGLDLVVALLAVWQAGGAYVPLDSRYPAERLAFLLADSAPTVLLTDHELMATLPTPATEVVCLDQAWAEIALLPATAPVVARHPEQLAYLIYTSGTTGQPKAVMVEHRQLALMLAGSGHRFSFDATDTMPWIASVAFDISLLEVFSMLLVGGTTRIVTLEQVLDLPLLVAELAQCTVLHAVPSVMQQLVATLIEQPELAARCQGLRLIFTGGDAVPPELLADLQRLFPQATVFVLYGPTEATVIATSYAVPRGLVPSGHIVGRPLPNVRLRIVDRYGSQVPIGAAGELQIGGPQVTRGYWQRPALTAEKYCATDAQRWYRTGDLARYRADGVIEFLGRIDHQVKLHGFRIELGEIESTLRQHPAVAEAAVLIRDETGDKRLVAYVVEEQRTTEQRTTEQTENPDAQRAPGTKNQELSGDVLSPSPIAMGEGGVAAATEVRARDEGLNPSDLRAYLKDRLPDYMVPSTFVPLDALPLTPNGKLDRNALPVPGDARLQLDAEFVAPRTATEARLAQLWTEVLGVERVGVYDHFFELGGHSLLAAQVIARARSLFGAQLTLRMLFEAPTIAGLAEAIDRRPAEQPDLEDDIPLLARGEQSLDQLLLELEQLSDDSITSLLASERQSIDETSQQEMP